MARTNLPTRREPRRGRRALKQLRDQLDQERVSFMSNWRELADYIQPRAFRKGLEDVNRGDKRSSKIINLTATLAARTLGAGMHGGITSPSRPWFRLTTPNQEIAEDHEAKIWLTEVTRRMSTVMLRSNLYKTLPMLYRGAGTFATAAFFIEEDMETAFRCTFLPLGSYWIGNDARGKATILVREFRMTVRQVVEKFGLREDGVTIDWTNISQRTRNLWERGATEALGLEGMDIDLFHVIGPPRPWRWRHGHSQHCKSKRAQQSRKNTGE